MCTRAGRRGVVAYPIIDGRRAVAPRNTIPRRLRGLRGGRSGVIHSRAVRTPPSTRGLRSQVVDRRPRLKSPPPPNPPPKDQICGWNDSPGEFWLLCARGVVRWSVASVPPLRRRRRGESHIREYNIDAAIIPQSTDSNIAISSSAVALCYVYPFARNMRNTDMLLRMSGITAHSHAK